MKAYDRGRIQCNAEASTVTSAGRKKSGRGRSAHPARKGHCGLLQAQRNVKAIVYTKVLTIPHWTVF